MKIFNDNTLNLSDSFVSPMGVNLIGQLSHSFAQKLPFSSKGFS